MKLTALVLAAGSARRFGGDKLSAQFRSEPLVRHAIRAARVAPVNRVIVICGNHLDIGEWPSEPAIDTVRIASTAMSQSLKAGIAAIGAADGAFIFLGDMPLVPHTVAGKLASALGDAFAALPRHAGKIGHPALLSNRVFLEIERLSGDEGAGKLLRQRSDIAFVEIDDDAILLDVDKTEDLIRLEQRKT